MQAFGFKEWSFICEFLGSGRQSIILRKGGIHEGRKGFEFNHDEFFLFPTHFHEQGSSVKESPFQNIEPDLTADKERESITISLFAETIAVHEIDNWEVAARLQPFHLWKEEVIRERFEYSEKQGLSLALIRVHALAEPWTFPNERGFGGCRSWLTLPESPSDWKSTASPVLSSAAFSSVESELGKVLNFP